MTKPENFIGDSDYATLKNDAWALLTVTFPGSQAISGGGTLSFSDSTTAGVAGASERAQIYSSKIDLRYVGSILVVSRNATSSFGSIPYSMVADLSRTGPNTLTASVTVVNNQAFTITTASGSEMFTFYVATFVPPFA